MRYRIKKCTRLKGGCWYCFDHSTQSGVTYTVLGCFSCAWAAASRAMGTRKGEQDT